MGGSGSGSGSGYYASLTLSVSLVLDEFYNHLHKVGVSLVYRRGYGGIMEGGSSGCCGL